MSEQKLSQPIVAANWKMHPGSLPKAQSLFANVKRTASHLQNVTTVICPPALYLGAVASEYGGTKIIFGSQDVSTFARTGSRTGEMSAEMVKNAGGKTAIIGHSERRDMGETNDVVAQKVKRALTADLHVMLCIGEASRDDEGEYLDFLRNQLLAVYRKVADRFYDRIIIAYEPLWAIGGKADQAVTPHTLHQTAGFIRKVLRTDVAQALGDRATLLYGGSVKRDNARELLDGTEIDGFLVGSASLSADHFCDILRIVNKTQNED